MERCLYFPWQGDFCDAAHFCFLVYLGSPVSPLEDTTGRNNSVSFQSLEVINLFGSQIFFLGEKCLRKILIWLIPIWLLRPKVLSAKLICRLILKVLCLVMAVFKTGFKIWLIFIGQTGPSFVQFEYSCWGMPSSFWHQAQPILWCFTCQRA